MQEDSAKRQALLQAQLESLIAAHVDVEVQPQFRSFLGYYFEMASLAALTARNPDQLFHLAWQHWQLAASRQPDEALVAIFPPVGPGQMASLYTVTDDMPFLMDSVSMMVRDAGTAIDWSIHPVIQMRRDDNGNILQVLGVGDGLTPAESLIHVQFEPLADEEDYAALEQQLRLTLADLRVVVADFPAMKERVQTVLDNLAVPFPQRDPEEQEEACAFLHWLLDEHFTFLGYARSVAHTEKDGISLELLDDQGLGLARAGSRYANADEFIAPHDEMAKYIASGRLAVVTKANMRSPIHHPNYMDVVSIKRLAADGSVEGTDRFIGLFSLDAYINRPRDIPLIRRKVEEVLTRSRLPERSHSGKHLRDIIYQLPRDELFQGSEDELFQTCMGIRALRDRHRLRLFMRRDRYGRFYSCMVYLTRERFSRELRDRVTEELLSICNGLSVERTVDFLREGLARIHCIIRIPRGTRLAMSDEQVEQRLIAATHSWSDQLRELLREDGDEGMELARRFAEAFPPGYTTTCDPMDAAADLHYLTQLSARQPLLPRLSVENEGGAVCPTQLRLYSWHKPVGLSDVLPALENFGLRVIRQEPTRITPRDGEPLWIQQFDVQVHGDCALGPAQQKAYFEEAFLQCWQGQTENDGLNRLVLLAGLDARQVVCLRLITKYLTQTGLPYSQPYMEQLLADHARFATLLVKLFEARFDPQRSPERRETEGLAQAQALDEALDKVASLDADRVLRAYLGVVRAGLRTNYYQCDSQGHSKAYVSLKLDPHKVPDLPEPRPMFETFIYSPQMEGIHLRGGPVARGGLRWSDRREDFRTEVLGLVKAQMVKNAIIVPVGAKGGFVVKGGDPGDRQAWQQRGVACYKTFIRGLLDITDNREGDQVIAPAQVVRYDKDDPYLVVAADKGTATFSDIANGLAEEYGFWLGDAFASGGSAGYDHKQMGITARGAWESVKRHFREEGKDTQSTPFTVVGIGDMGGDVFGNGMLLSDQIQLVAAFNHLHIVIDPTPDPARTFAERQRLFETPGTSWEDFDRDCLSEGGGIWPRSAKSITLSEPAMQALGLTQSTYTPAELITAILKAPVELLWNGGIGTYVKASHESHAQVGDRANDAIRINGRDLRCKVVGEGGNLGLTQLGRIEYALNGGRINTDAIDNSGGVHSSDREVNIKIPLNQMVREAGLTRETRDPMLVRMTEDVARSVLRDNYVQSLALSLLENDAMGRLDEHANQMRLLERNGFLSRTVEFLPDDEALNERRNRGKGLTRPELAVLLSYSKNALSDALLASKVPDDGFFDRDVLAYFPTEMQQEYRDALLKHRLRRELIATVLANAVVNRMGFCFAHRYADEHGLALHEPVKAYAMAHAIFDGDAFWAPLDALDNHIDSRVQLRLYGRVIGLMKHITSWLINYRWAQRPVKEAVGRYRDAIAELSNSLPRLLPGSYLEDWQDAVAGMEEDGVPTEVARQLANTMVLGSAPDIIELASSAQVSVEEAAQAYFLVGDSLHILWLLSSIIGLTVQSRWQALARSSLREDTYKLHRQVTAKVLEQPGDGAQARFQHWQEQAPTQVRFGIMRLQALQSDSVHDFMSLAVGVRELRKLRSL
ncbi:NAD-glutamate dehydrogenase [Alcanivorax hongdengensis A-11-3]|uniref:NAD-glutamate dehydrogenase n=1 Tax=Alcanivorax hongdengensis A-11-3 TaxID=1177179 RepID=L0WFW5_9GAMM|nr:NAD-glutamate dehydrogenase [Alcanivorax hongdengensis]EKF75042.1 NAD-glutamate dehydrogenase [Alcanivorax hongdengensis A-11-3]